MRIAISGSIGCGKSTVVSRFLPLLPDFVHFDFDKSVHALYERPEFQLKLLEKFGTADRKAISNLAFNDASLRRQLELISEEALRADLKTQLMLPNVLVEFPMLFEAGWFFDQFDLVLVVSCDAEIQIQRVLARDKISEEKLHAILGAQLSLPTKIAMADLVIPTDVPDTELQNHISSVACFIHLENLRLRATRRFGHDGWKALEAAYGEEHRAYHTLSHVRAMLTLFDRYRDAFSHPLAVELAIWFHDFVYQTFQPAAYQTNEAASVRAMVQVLRGNAPALFDIEERGVSPVSLAAELILCTKRHEVTSDYLLAHPLAEADARLFLDIDLSILAEDALAVKSFDNAIRNEFLTYDNSTFARGRAEVLANFLARPKIFQSPQFADKEGVARRHLERLLTHWTDALAGAHA
jgi:dephospho-CoA kinase